ncbi:alpha-lactalbumin [Periophthalmus magnuspinnatus]|uniref:alpha-lactalbumin n=1 Tax=Periophthalmus magnuspinnatus TaxID=409849 RepID=UPI0024368131|nr:alpha-lactalbumin [Periophthalmus magnuspinnatus]
MKRASAVAVLLLVVALFGGVVEGKVYEKCEVRALLKAGLKKSTDTTIEKIVCHVSQSSNYDSSVVNTVNVTQDDGSVEKWTMYGLFQITQHFCTGKDGLCKIDCKDLIDDDLTDDIQCVEDIKRTFLKNPTGANKIYREIIPKLFTPNCPKSILSDCD